MTFSNPRKAAEFPDWPSGRSRVRCKFEMEVNPKRGVRVGRTTQDKHGKWCKTKWDVYGGPAAIVDGDDGKTYILQDTPEPYDFIYVKSHDFMHVAAVFRSSDPERHAELAAIIAQAT